LTFAFLLPPANLGENYTIPGEEYPLSQTEPSPAIFGLLHAKIATIWYPLIVQSQAACFHHLGTEPNVNQKGVI